MASVPSPLAQLQPQGASGGGGQPPQTPPGTPIPGTGFALGMPGFTPGQPQGPEPGVDPEQTGPVGNVYEIDPLVLDRPCSIRVDGSSRMLSRSALQQIWPFIAQVTMSGPFLQALAAQGTTVEMSELERMLLDATGVMRQYRIFRPMTQQEQQLRQMPSPGDRIKMQLGQQEQQTRTQIMQMKMDNEKAIAQVKAATDNKQIDEESARHILGLLQQEMSDQAAKPDPRLELAQKQADLQQQSQEHAMNMRQQAQQHVMGLQQQAREHAQSMQQQGQEHTLNMLAKLHEQRLNNQASQQAMADKHQQEAIKARSILAQGMAKAQAARMMPEAKEPRRASRENDAKK